MITMTGVTSCDSAPSLAVHRRKQHRHPSGYLAAAPAARFSVCPRAAHYRPRTSLVPTFQGPALAMTASADRILFHQLLPVALRSVGEPCRLAVTPSHCAIWDCNGRQTCLHIGLSLYALAGFTALSLRSGLAAGLIEDPDIRLIGTVTSAVSGIAGVAALGATSIKGRPLYQHLRGAIAKVKAGLSARRGSGGTLRASNAGLASSETPAGGTVVRMMHRRRPQQSNPRDAAWLLDHFDVEYASSLANGRTQPSGRMAHFMPAGEMETEWYPVMRQLNRIRRLSPQPRDHEVLSSRWERRAHSLNDLGHDTAEPWRALPLMDRIDHHAPPRGASSVHRLWNC